MTDPRYGMAPTVLNRWSFPEWTEFLHYFYLPVKFPGAWDDIRLPQRLSFLYPLVVKCMRHFHTDLGDIQQQYVYVTARHGYASPDNPLNRPGWHADGFGTEDINYVWSDRYPTRYAVHDFKNISSDHNESLAQFDAQARTTVVHPPGQLVMLNPYVVHATPEVPPPGGNRKFVKVSISPDKYNLLGNSHNYRFDYTWKMWDRSEIRNNPQYAGRDSGPDE